MNKDQLEDKLEKLAQKTNINKALLKSGYYAYRIKKIYIKNNKNIETTNIKFDLEQINNEIYPVFERYINKRYGEKT
jgi:hypothetical protein